MDQIQRLSQLAMIVIGTVVLATALRSVSSIFAPLTLALVAGVVLSPLTVLWERAGLPRSMGALATLFLAIALIGLLVIAFQPIVAQLVAQAPKVWADMQETVQAVQRMMRSLARLTADVTEAIAPDAAGENAPNAAPPMTLPTISDALLLAPAFLGQFLIFSGALFFFVLTRAEIYTWVAHRLSAPTERAQTTRRLLAAERRVSKYFLAITLVNAGLGVAMVIVLQLIGLPGAVLWGVIAFLMNYIVYLGPAALSLGLLFAGVAAFDGLMSLAPAVIFVTLNSIEGQFITPTFLGKQLSLNPLVVFLSLIIGIWLWGPLGGVVAIPVLVWILVLNDALNETGT